MSNNYTDWIRLYLIFACPVSSATFVRVSRILVISIWGELWPSLTCAPGPHHCAIWWTCVWLTLLSFSPPSPSLPLLTPHPYTSFPSNTETDQPSLVWFDRGKFYLTFEGKLGLISKDVARAHSSLIWHLTSPFFSCIRSFIKTNCDAFACPPHICFSLYFCFAI